MTIERELAKLGVVMQLTGKPDAPQPDPDFGHEAQERDHGGVIDLNEATAGDRATVKHIREWQKNRDRNETPRRPEPPKDAA